jgi:hypothetical protein
VQNKLRVWVQFALITIVLFHNVAFARPLTNHAIVQTLIAAQALRAII